MTIKYKEGDDYANIEALKKEMFNRAINPAVCEGPTIYSAQGSALAAISFAHLVKAQFHTQKKL